MTRQLNLFKPHKSQTDILKAAFDRGEVLTVAEALTKYGIYALSQRVGELIHKHKYPVTSEMWITPTGKRVARYHKLLVPYG